MMESLPGLMRLLSTCRRLKLSLKTTPPVQKPPRAGALINGLPLDPMLADFYERFGEAWFAYEEVGIIVDPFAVESSMDGRVGLEEENRSFSQSFQSGLAIPVLVFAGEPALAYRYATIPELADAEGRQPVVWVDTYEEPYALPVASSVDHFFNAYAVFLEALVRIPGFKQGGVLSFPFDMAHVFGRDKRLVELIRGGHFEPLLSPVIRKDKSVQEWFRKILAAARNEQSRS